MYTSTEARIETLPNGVEDLSAPQREAVTHTNGPLLILAGPGSGKTRVVTRRAAHLAATVATPDQILALTFTNKAATEMRERIAALGVADGMTVSTFHALCARLLRIYHDRAGIDRRFTIFDRADRRRVIKQAIEECNLASDNWPPAAIERDISLAKNDLLTPTAFAEARTDWRSQTVARIYAQYEKLLNQMAGLDFDDLLMRMATLLESDAELCGMLEDRYRYVLIDEYQDTNTAQYRIARLITQQRQNICATGDPDQSIYGWRGADIGNILRFERDYPAARVVRLEQNYRSTRRILQAAGELIRNNVRRKQKELWTGNDEGAPIRVIECDDARAEAGRIAGDIGTHLRNGTSAGDIAVFYRVNSMSRTIEEALLREGIPYQIARGVEFYSRKEIKDVLAYLRVLVNPADEVSLLRIINTPTRGIGNTTVERLRTLAARKNTSLFELITSDADLSPLGRSADRVRQFGVLLSGSHNSLQHPPADCLRTIVSQTGLYAMYTQQGDGEDAPIENINELINAAAEYQDSEPDATITDWLEHTALVSDVDSVDECTPAVTLMTLHAAKGLEFPVVYILGLEENLLPFRRHDDEGYDIEEERRLLFVGMTRAKQALTLSHARVRMIRGVGQRTVRSPFLDELPDAPIQWQRPEAATRRRPTPGPAGRLPEDIEQWAVGTLVRHPIHGLGRVTSIERGTRRTPVAVQFQDGTHRKWVLEFASLTRVDFDEVGDLD